MNRLELEKFIISEGKKRGIRVKGCNIHDRGEYLEFYPTINNPSAKGWVCRYQVEELISDLAPLERPHRIRSIDLAHRVFKIGEKVEIDNLWIRLDAGEKEPRKLISVHTGCGRYRQGWIKGIVVETPAENDISLVIKFNRDIYFEKEHKWWGDVNGLEKGVKEGKIKKIEKGQPLYIGTARWEVRKV